MTKAETAMSHSAQFADGTGSTPKSEKQYVKDNPTRHLFDSNGYMRHPSFRLQ